MAIISQDAIKFGCSGGQGKIHAQTTFEHAAQIVQQLHLRRTSVENLRQIPVPSTALGMTCFMQNKANPSTSSGQVFKKVKWMQN
jgi:hypothetical protein